MMMPCGPGLARGGLDAGRQVTGGGAFDRAYLLVLIVIIVGPNYLVLIHSNFEFIF